jgi:outer membrane protein OmpA-like peptidoglycan-associated protein
MLGASSPSSLPEAIALRRCRADAQIAKAERLVDAVRVLALQPPAPLMLAGGIPQSAPAPVPVPVGQPLRRVVHFALDSSTLAPESRRVLDGVVAVLRDHPHVTVALEGYADPRGNVDYNRALSARRAESVRRYLAAADSTLDRVTIAAFGGDRRESSESSKHAFARDRRVTVQFYAPDGTPLTAAGLAAINDHDGDLQMESAVTVKTTVKTPATARPKPRTARKLAPKRRSP